MTVYVRRNGVLVDKVTGEPMTLDHANPVRFPSPRLSSFVPMESPVTGKEITSWRERDRDMDAAGACDPRDLPPPTKGRRPADGQ